MSESQVRPSLLAADEFDDTEEGLDSRSRMSFLEHLDELRRRIIYSLYAIGACCAVTFWYWDDMFKYLTRYFQRYGGTLIYTQPTAAFMFNLKVGFLAGLILASPFVFSQIWLFVAPGLYAREKRVVIPFVASASVLFGGGVWFAHVFAFPAMWRFFASYQIESLQFFPNLDTTFSFYVKVVIGLGIIFQMPILVFFLARFGIVSAKFLIKKFKYAILGIFILAALVTPSADMVTQLTFAAPMIVLYIVSIGVAWLFGRKRSADEAT